MMLLNPCAAVRANASLRLMYVQRHCLNMKLKKMLCDSLVLLHLHYICRVDVNRVEKLQNLCLRLICGIEQRISHKLRDVRWLNMYNRRNLQKGSRYCRQMTAPP